MAPLGFSPQVISPQVISPQVVSSQASYTQASYTQANSPQVTSTQASSPQSAASNTVSQPERWSQQCPLLDKCPDYGKSCPHMHHIIAHGTRQPKAADDSADGESNPAQDDTSASEAVAVAGQTSVKRKDQVFGVHGQWSSCSRRRKR
ncbi:hypothetical protein CGLO_10156 [Colletotrichum gloeosporioides Cg-14]|uniref:Uncharacterized protein n=1 Tax=Colletotrichum gloeosporioides (strain Cg-14) TaxID=1237896 RepID=T0LFQ7_COLGC|nr:hypothetical protein CGLO_10156 [Colletotrichum gloeosporioides Cg-14]